MTVFHWPPDRADICSLVPGGGEQLWKEQVLLLTKLEAARRLVR